MSYERKNEHADYEKASRLIGELFDAETEITEQINRHIQNIGICKFFSNLEDYKFSADVLEKLHAIRLILFGIGQVYVISEAELREINNSNAAAVGGEEI